MSGTDSESAPRRRPEAPRPHLPRILDLKLERVSFEPPSYRFVKSVYQEEEALAFTIDLDDDLRLDRDSTPVLYVGDVALSHAESLGRHRYRFLAFGADERRLEEGMPISLGWPGLPTRRRSRFRFEPSDDAR